MRVKEEGSRSLALITLAFTTVTLTTLALITLALTISVNGVRAETVTNALNKNVDVSITVVCAINEMNILKQAT